MFLWGVVFVKLEGIQGVASSLAFKILYFKTALCWTHGDLILVILALEDDLEKFKASLTSSLELNRSCLEHAHLPVKEAGLCGPQGQTYPL